MLLFQGYVIGVVPLTVCCGGRGHESSCHETTETVWVVCVQLSLVVEVWNAQTMDVEEAADAPHVLSLWRAGKEKRVLLWAELQPQLQLHELGLGGEFYGSKCPVDVEEVALLFPQGSLVELQHLFLYAMDRWSDCGLGALVSAGCGAHLSSLSLDGE